MGAVANCPICEDAFAPGREVVYDSEHFIGYVTPAYPWGVILTARRHECDGPWALTEPEAIDLGKTIPRLTAAIRKTGSERVYVIVIGEDRWQANFMPHFHVGFLSRFPLLSQAEHEVMYARVNSTPDPVQVALEFAAAVRANF